MKLRKINFKNHPVLHDLQVSFEDKNGKILNTVVFIGNNGSGKTSILRGIFENFAGTTKRNIKEKDILEVSFGKGVWGQVQKSPCIDQQAIKSRIIYDTIKYDEKDCEAIGIGKIVFMPTEINFNIASKVDTRKKVPDKFVNIIDQKMTSDISSFIATKIETAVFENEDLPVRESIKKTCDEINSVFRCMNLDVEVIGLSKDEKKQPIFQNRNKNTFSIESLSSGEKQLFLRALSLKFLNVNDSIILIDEPEISLHPEWQRKIISVYESIGRNNQLIVATHSPHVIGDIRKEQLRILTRNIEGIHISSIDEVEQTYGQTIESILIHNMGLESVRNDNLQLKLDTLKKLLRNDNALQGLEFQELLKYVSEHLDDSDVEMALINAQIQRIKMRGAKKNVEN